MEKFCHNDLKSHLLPKSVCKWKWKWVKGVTSLIFCSYVHDVFLTPNTATKPAAEDFENFRSKIKKIS